MSETLRPSRVTDIALVTKETAKFFVAPVSRTIEDIKRSGWKDGLKYSGFLLVAPPALSALAYTGFRDSSPVGAAAIGALIWTMECMILKQNPSMESINQTLGVNLEEEAKNFRRWQNGRGIEWDFKINEDGSFERIVCGVNENNISQLRVDMLSDDQLITREPTPEEMVKFTRVADYVDHKSPHVKRLRSMAHQRILKQEDHLLALRRMIYR